MTNNILPDKISIDKFISNQLSVWPEVAASFRELKDVKIKEIEVNGLKTRMQCNPARIASTTAEIDEASLSARPCFLCKEHLPEKQLSMPFEGRKGRKYFIRINPFPIFPNHLVISRDVHENQSIWNRFVDIADLADEYGDFVFFYNGPVSGASAPDHLHFQAAPKGLMPLENAVNEALDAIPYDRDKWEEFDGAVQEDADNECDVEYLTSVQDAHLYHYKHYTRGVFALRAATLKSLTKLFYRLLDCANIREDESEPRFNLFVYQANGEYRTIVMMRDALRSRHYFAEGEDHLTVSPGCADMAGVYVAPMLEDFQKANQRLMSEMMSEVSINKDEEAKIISRLTRRQPDLEVGIMSEKEISFEIISDGAGPQKVTYRSGKIDYNGTLYDELRFDAVTMSTMFAEPSFILYGVTIGVDFHWERKMEQKFAGTLKFIVENEKITAVNIIGVEDYLLSVISSEMKASATLEFLKAHAVISRSWVMSQIKDRLGFGKKDVSIPPILKGCQSYVESHADAHIGELSHSEIEQQVIWFDHEDHKNFDVCADDHCQRYQGLTMATGENVRKAIDMTWGEILVSEGDICDARFSKCCGGAMEVFSACWGDRDYKYLVGKLDSPAALPSVSGSEAIDVLPDLTIEDNARKWILNGYGVEKDSYCNTEDDKILSQVLNDYDMETKDFFRWKVEYSREEISELLKKRSGIDFGLLQALVPIERGVSGRLYRMEFIGEKKRMIVGKELIIRKYLSESHLKSSAFIVSYLDSEGKEIDEEKILNGVADGRPVDFAKIVLTGAGWGHGVGLCQIGAAVMAYEKVPYNEILAHYYPGSKLERFEMN